MGPRLAPESALYMSVIAPMYGSYLQPYTGGREGTGGAVESSRGWEHVDVRNGVDLVI